MNRMRRSLAVGLGFGAAAACSLVAAADVVQFNNHDGVFPWGLYITFGGATVGHPYLNVTMDATQPGTTPLPHSFVHQARPFITSGDWSEDRLAGSPIGANLSIIAGTPVHVDHWFDNTYMDLVLTPPRLMQRGEVVGSASNYVSYAVIGGTVRTRDQRRVPFDLVGRPDYFVGISFSLSGQTHFGWVRLRNDSNGFIPYEWAYETTPNTPIQIPILCPADYKEDGTVDSADFFDFLPAFFAGGPSGDFNHDGFTNSQDFFDFIAAFFTEC